MRRVYIDFVDDAMAERFADDLMAWLCEEIHTPGLVGGVPRHHKYADADVCAVTVHDDGGQPGDD